MIERKSTRAHEEFRVARVYARTEVLRGFAVLANLTLPAGRIVLGGGPAWDSGAGAGAGRAGVFSAKFSIETPTTKTVSKAYIKRRRRALTLCGVRDLVDPDQAVADLKHVVPEYPAYQKRWR